jgi:hypothetical protein
MSNLVEFNLFDAFKPIELLTPFKACKVMAPDDIIVKNNHIIFPFPNNTLTPMTWDNYSEHHWSEKSINKYQIVKDCFSLGRKYENQIMGEKLNSELKKFIVKYGPIWEKKDDISNKIYPVTEKQDYLDFAEDYNRMALVSLISRMYKKTGFHDNILYTYYTALHKKHATNFIDSPELNKINKTNVKRLISGIMEKYDNFDVVYNTEFVVEAFPRTEKSLISYSSFINPSMMMINEITKKPLLIGICDNCNNIYFRKIKAGKKELCSTCSAHKKYTKKLLQHNDTDVQEKITYEVSYNI